MSTSLNTTAKPGYKKAIADIYVEMESLTADSPEFAKCVEQLQKLNKIKLEEKELKHKIRMDQNELNLKKEENERSHALNVEELASKKKIKFSPDALLAIAGNLAGIATIILFEKSNVMTSKSLGFVMKSKL